MVVGVLQVIQNQKVETVKVDKIIKDVLLHPPHTKDFFSGNSLWELTLATHSGIPE
jgi:hypothetical protein